MAPGNKAFREVIAMIGRSVLKKWLLIVLTSSALLILALTDSACRPKRHIHRIVPLHPDARRTLVEFQAALKDCAWERALTLCSESVKTAAKTYDSPGMFFSDVVPVEQIIGLRKFDISAARYEGTRRLNVFACKWSVPVGIDSEGWSIVQKYELTRNGDRWEIAFPCEPLGLWMERILRRRGETKRQLAEVAKAMLRQQAKERGEPVPTDEFLAEKQAEGVASKQKQAEERRQRRLLQEERRVQLMARVDGVYVVLRAAKLSFRRREPMLFDVELVNGGDASLYYRFLRTGDSLTVLDDRGRIMSYMGTEYEVVGPARMEPGQRIALFENYDIADAYAIDQPGRYRIEFNGHGLTVGDKLGADLNVEPLYAPVDFVSSMIQVEVLR